MSDTHTPWIDAHCHLAHTDITPRHHILIAEAEQAGAHALIQAGINQSDWDQQLELKKQYPALIHPVFGIHPWEINPAQKTDLLQQLAALPAYLPHAIALGETGLDLGPRHHPDSLPLQIELFEAQLQLAAEHQLPLVLHIVHAHEQALQILRKFASHQRRQVTGIVHSFGGSLTLARNYIDLGLTLSIGPAIARQKGFETLKKAMISLPAQSWVIESDAPDREGRGPILTLEVARALARIRNEDETEILNRTTQLARKVFGLC